MQFLKAAGERTLQMLNKVASGSTNSAGGNNLKAMVPTAKSSQTNSASSLPFSLKKETKSSQKTHEQIIFLFTSICEAIDEMAESSDWNSDRLLQQSNINEEMRQMIDILRNESENWFLQYSENPDPRIEDMPCLHSFLNIFVMKNLCRRMVPDRPRGLFPLMLLNVATLLRGVRYPLLAQQNVNIYVAHMISVAVHYSSYHSSSKEMSHVDQINYRKRIDKGLMSLLSIVWKKIEENPLILTAFVVQEKKKMGQSSSPSHHFYPQMDILTALISLSNSPRVGQNAKESLLVALSMKHQVIDSYFLLFTSFLQDLVRDLSIRFVAVLESKNPLSLGHSATNAMMENNEDLTTTSSSSTGYEESMHTPVKNNNIHMGSSNTPSPSSSSYHPLTPRQAESRLSPLELFMRSLKFVSSVLSVCSDHSPQQDDFSLYFDSSTSSTSSPSTRKAMFNHLAGQKGLFSSLKQLFVDNFLQNTLQEAIQKNEEYASIGFSTLVKAMIDEMAQTLSHIPSNILLTETINYLVSKSIMTNVSPLDVIVSRAGSVTKEVSLASMGLITSILKFGSLAIVTPVFFTSSEAPRSHETPSKIWQPLLSAFSDSKPGDNDQLSLSRHRLMILRGFIGSLDLNPPAAVTNTLGSRYNWNLSISDWKLYSEMATTRILSRNMKNWKCCGSNYDNDSTGNISLSCNVNDDSDVGTKALECSLDVSLVAHGQLISLFSKKMQSMQGFAIEEKFALISFLELFMEIACCWYLSTSQDNVRCEVLDLMVNLVFSLDKLWWSSIIRLARNTTEPLQDVWIAAMYKVIVNYDHVEDVDYLSRKLLSEVPNATRKNIEMVIFAHEMYAVALSFLTALIRLSLTSSLSCENHVDAINNTMAHDDHENIDQSMIDSVMELDVTDYLEGLMLPWLAEPASLSQCVQHQKEEEKSIWNDCTPVKKTDMKDIRLTLLTEMDHYRDLVEKLSFFGVDLDSAMATIPDAVA